MLSRLPGLHGRRLRLLRFEALVMADASTPTSMQVAAELAHPIAHLDNELDKALARFREV